ncbi:MAG TPA: hypothetical protein PK514_12690 [Spirochaetota bacterium]|nr:hypothetical protein [Spirochaetota bacterium]
MGNTESATQFLCNRIAAFLFSILLVVSFLPQSVLPQVKDPDLPVSPEIEYKQSTERKTWPVEVNYNGGVVTGEIDPGSEYFSDAGKGTACYWSEISSIRITGWVRHVKGKGYAFYPETYEITLKSGAKLQLSGNIKELNRFRVIKNRQRRTMYTYYYDDYVKGAWAATGVTDFYSPVIKPAEGCVVSITFR